MSRLMTEKEAAEANEHAAQVQDGKYSWVAKIPHGVGQLITQCLGCGGPDHSGWCE